MLVSTPPLKLLHCNSSQKKLFFRLYIIFFILISESLEKNGISVWVDVVGLGAGVDFLSKIGQAILDAKVLYVVLSSISVKSQF